MANKKNKKKVQDQANTKPATNSKASAKKAAKAKKNAKPGLFANIKNYFGSVRSEMKRVSWPSKQEFIKLSVTVCVSLIVVGVAIALIDAVVGEGLVLFSGLRG